MNFCAIICEFNPFHNGHEYLLNEASKLSGCEGVLCIMSGNFTQRGEMCILGKHVRAKHAILGGADCVIQLPSPFTVAPAEIFAKGAIKILSAIPDVTTLAFGCESGDAQSFYRSAEILINESENFKRILSERLSDGESYIKSYASAFEACGGNKNIISSPNNVLALEYTKAVLRLKSDIKILPVGRVGAGYNDGELKENFSSASAIRQNLTCNAVKNNLPDFVYEDLKYSFNNCAYENFLRHCLFKSKTYALKHVYGCGEGLENKLKNLENQKFESIIANATSKRYSSSRIRRILCANALELYGDDCERFLNADLYVKPLAVKKRRADEVLAALAKSDYPVITDPYGENLAGVARECFEKDVYECKVYNHITNQNEKDYMSLI